MKKKPTKTVICDSVSMTFRLPAHLKEDLQARATQQGLGLSEYVKELLFTPRLHDDTCKLYQTAELLDHLLTEYHNIHTLLDSIAFVLAYEKGHDSFVAPRDDTGTNTSVLTLACVSLESLSVQTAACISQANKALLDYQQLMFELTNS